jgi:hypothetical protein
MLKFLRLALLLIGLLALPATIPPKIAAQDQSTSSWILYVKSSQEIHAVDPEGGDHLLFRTSWPMDVHGLSPDGEWLLVERFVQRTDTGKFYRIRTDGSEINEIPVAPRSEYDSGWWSPDGEWIMFYILAPGAPELHWIRPDGTDHHHIATYLVAHPVLSPNGQQLAFSRSDGVFVTRSDATNPRRLSLPENIAAPTFSQWSPDGEWILLLTQQEGRPHNTLYRVNPDGSHLVKLTAFEQGYDFPSISPDGQWIVYGDFYTLYRIRSDGTKRERLTPPPYQYAQWNPQFSPDSQWILYRWYENGEIVWRRMRADGTSPKTVVSGDVSAMWWTPPPSMSIP